LQHIASQILYQILYNIRLKKWTIPNKYLDRPVDQEFWGTRTQHIVGVAACLAVTDHASQALFSSYLG
jgi:hypothetical protein